MISLAALLTVVVGAASAENCDLQSVSRQFAEAGDAFWQVVLAIQYVDGECVPEDPDEAVRWARLAARQGHAVAQSVLGEMYRTGYGPMEQDYAEAAYWFLLAAEQNHPDMHQTRYKLGVLYLLGLGVPRDFVTAYAWLNVAAVRHEQAGHLRDVVAKSLTVEQIAEGQRLARNLWERINAGGRAPL